MIGEAKRDFEQKQRKRQDADTKRDAIVLPARGNLLRTRSDKIYQFTEKLEQRRRRNNYPDRQWASDQTGKQIPVASTWPSIKAAAERIGVIVTQILPPLALEALDDEELDRRLEEIEATIPTIEMTKIV